MTDAERKALKEKLNKQIDELSDEELAQVSGALPGDTTEPIICPYCNATFYNKVRYAYHMMANHYDKLQ